MQLHIELITKILKDLGATPFSMEKEGSTHPDLLVKDSLKLITENNVEKQIPMWYGEAIGSENIMCVLISNLNYPDHIQLEVAAIIAFKNLESKLLNNSIHIGMQFDWTSTNDPGLLSIKTLDKSSNYKWIPMSLAQKLRLALGFEEFVQEGIILNPGALPLEMKKSFAELIDLDFSIGQ